MTILRQFARGVRALLRPAEADRDVGDEVAHYLDEAAAEYVRKGLTPEAARRAAAREVGSATVVREQVRGSGWEHVVATVVRDARHAVRSLRKAPLFTLVAILVVAVGTGAVSTIYSALNAVVLRPLPGAADGRSLVGIERRRPDADDGVRASYAYFDYLRRSTRTLDDVAVWSRASFVLSTGSGGIAAYGNIVSGNYFSVLGVRPALGRFFVPEEDRTPLTHPVIVLSHGFWNARLGADSAIVGGHVMVNGRRYTVIGVAPPGFHGVFTPLRVDAWVPMMMRGELRAGRDTDHANWLWMFGRLNGDATRETVRRDLEILTQRFVREGAEPADRKVYTAVRVSPLNGLPVEAHRMAAGFLGLLFGGAVLLLLIASVNLAALLSARAMARRREMAVRAALGAGRGRLVAHMLTEVSMLFTAGAVVGIGLTLLATSALGRVVIPADVPIALEVSPDLRVFAFAFAASFLTGIAVGLSPALRATRTDVALRLRDGGAGAGARRTIAGRALIAGQLALSLVLLVAGGLFLRAVAHGARVDPGFDAAGVATVMFNTEAWGYDADRGDAFYRALRERLAATPGVETVSFVGNMPLAFSTMTARVEIPGREPSGRAGSSGEVIEASWADADFFAALRMPLVAGRPIGAGDDDRAPRVAVVNQTMAARFWPDGNALGRSFMHGGEPVTIIGIARDAKYGSLGETTPAYAYFSIRQRWQSTRVLLVRATIGLDQIAGSIRGAVLAFDPMLPQPDVVPLERANSIVLLPQRIAAAVSGALGALGLLLAAVGLYGVIAYGVSRRTREIGVRVALGADPGAVRRLIVGEGARLAAAATVVGLLLAAGASQLLAGLLVGVRPLDPLTFATAAVVLLGVAFMASYVPARRAATVEPIAALRED